jgi:hypothetical protein
LGSLPMVPQLLLLRGRLALLQFLLVLVLVPLHLLLPQMHRQRKGRKRMPTKGPEAEGVAMVCSRT